MATTHLNTVQHTATQRFELIDKSTGDHTTLQHATTHCNTPQHTATHYFKHFEGHAGVRNTLQHSATRCNTPFRAYRQARRWLQTAPRGHPS